MRSLVNVYILAVASAKKFLLQLIQVRLHKSALR